MKTHTLARELVALADALKRGPNVEINQLYPDLFGIYSDKSEMAFGISTLTQLSKFKRSEWEDFILEHNIPIKYNTRDSARNLIGKIMSYLSEHDDALDRVSESIERRGSGSSKRLNQAFKTLLREQ